LTKYSSDSFIISRGERGGNANEEGLEGSTPTKLCICPHRTYPLKEEKEEGDGGPDGGKRKKKGVAASSRPAISYREKKREVTGRKGREQKGSNRLGTTY